MASEPTRELSTYEVLDIDVYHIRYYISTPTSTVTYIGGSTQVDYNESLGYCLQIDSGKNSYGDAMLREPLLEILVLVK